MVKRPTGAEREAQLLRVLDTLLELPAPERRRRLEEESTDDPELRRRLERLLELEEEGELPRIAGLPALEELSPAQADSPGPADLERGTRVGSFELVRPLGRGGMGRVYEALQERPRRRVALKMLRVELESESTRRRFQWEAEVLARLKHPAIAQVYEADVFVEHSTLGKREVPYFAMEYVEGARPITEFARANGLDRRAIVELFLHVCAACHHGHQKGVVHRDLKPGNVLVDVEGRPKVIDFGIARVTAPELPDVGNATETPRETRVGELLGTVHYMSPEQLSGNPDDLDTRSDVYSLGVLLYELCCGRLPHDVEQLPLAAAARAIQEQDVLRPRRAVADLEEDLEAILLKALEKDPARRYASAEALADDLRRFLAHEPVVARTPSRGYRLRLFVRRNPVLSGAVMIVFVTLAIATFVSSRFAVRAQEAVAVKDDQIRVAEQAREAETIALERENELKRDLLEFHSSVLFDLVRQLDQATTEERVRPVRLAVEHLARIEARGSEDLDVLASLAEGYLRLGDLRGNTTQASNLGDLAGARESYARARIVAERMQALDPEDLRTLEACAMVQLREGDLQVTEARGGTDRTAAEQAVASYREALRLAPPPATRIRDGLINALIILGDSHGFARDHERSIAYHREAHELQLAAAAENPDDTGVLDNLTSTHGKLASNYRLAGQLDLAREHADATVALAERLVQSEPDVPARQSSLVGSYGVLIDVLTATGEYERAEELSRRCRTLLDTLRDADPGNAKLTQKAILIAHADGHNHKAWALSAPDDPAAWDHAQSALDCFVEALETIEWARDHGHATGRLDLLEEWAEIEVGRVEALMLEL